MFSAATYEHERKRIAGQSPSTTDALKIRGHRTGKRRKNNCRKITNVDTHLQCRGGDQHVGGLRVVGTALELALVAQAGLIVEQARVFAGDDSAHSRRTVEAAVVVVVAAMTRERSRASHEKAGRSLELIDHRDRARILGVANVTLKKVSPSDEIVELDSRDDDRLRGQRIDLSTRVRVDNIEQARVDETLQQDLGEPGTIVRRDIQTFACPAGVPALRRRNRVEIAVILGTGGRTADPGECWRFASFRECRHTL